jgi:hypothetical protein
VLCSNEVWAYAMMGDDVQAKKLLGRSRDELAKANLAEAPDWARFYNDTDMYVMTGTVHNELSALDPRHAAIAIPAFGPALAWPWPATTTRSPVARRSLSPCWRPATRRCRARCPGRPKGPDARIRGEVQASDRPAATIADRDGTAIQQFGLP